MIKQSRLGIKKALTNFEKQIIQTKFFEHRGIKVEINNKKIIRKPPTVEKLNSIPMIYLEVYYLEVIHTFCRQTSGPLKMPMS